jgi:hypothetical protein
MSASNCDPMIPTFTGWSTWRFMHSPQGLTWATRSGPCGSTRRSRRAGRCPARRPAERDREGEGRRGTDVIGVTRSLAVGGTGSRNVCAPVAAQTASVSSTYGSVAVGTETTRWPRRRAYMPEVRTLPGLHPLRRHPGDLLEQQRQFQGGWPTAAGPEGDRGGWGVDRVQAGRPRPASTNPRATRSGSACASSPRPGAGDLLPEQQQRQHVADVRLGVGDRPLRPEAGRRGRRRPSERAWRSTRW